MKIGIDARALQGETQFRGIGKSLEFFIETSPKVMGENDKLIFYIDKGLPKPELLKQFPGSKVIEVTSSPIGRMRYIRSVLPAYPRLKVKRSDVDVVIQYDAALGIPTNVPTLVIFHDLIPYLFRGKEKQMTATGLRKYKNKLAGNLYWKKYIRVLNSYVKAKHIVAISKASKLDLLKYDKRISKDSVSVIPHGVRPLGIHGKPTSKTRSLTSNPYLLYVGGIDLRKNIVGLLSAFFEVAKEKPNLHLIVVGKEFGLNDQLQDLGWTELMEKNEDLAKRVIIPGFLSEDDLFYMYENAAAFVFSSLYEGFGMPVLEAMQSGCPVIAYDNSSIPEVAGNAAIILPNGSDLTPSIRKLLESESLREELVQKGYKQVKKFTWESTAKKIVEQAREISK